jgi:hypothetical protein
MPNLYDLVACQGYFGIVIASDEVFLANGLRLKLAAEDMEKLLRLPLFTCPAAKPVAEGGSAANFGELLRPLQAAKTLEALYDAWPELRPLSPPLLLPKPERTRAVHLPD